MSRGNRGNRGKRIRRESLKPHNLHKIDEDDKICIRKGMSVYSHYFRDRDEWGALITKFLKEAQ
jgi:hypothetical protein